MLSDTPEVPRYPNADDPCPECGRIVELCEAADGTSRTPQPGDVSLCMGCGALMMFDQGLRILRVTDEAKLIAEMPPRIRETFLAARKIIRDYRALLARRSPSGSH